MSSELPEVESIAGAPGVLPTPFAMHGLASPLAGPYNGVPPAGGLAGLGGFPLGAAGLGVRVQGSAQASAVLLVSNLNEEVSISTTPNPLPTFLSSLTRCFPQVRRSALMVYMQRIWEVYLFIYDFLQFLKME